MQTIEQLRAISDQAIKVQSYWDDRFEKFTRLQMDIQSHVLDMVKKEVGIRNDVEKLLALRHARLTLQRQSKKLSQQISRIEEDVMKTEKDIIKMSALLAPESIYRDRIGRHWTSLSRYIGNTDIYFDESSGGEVFKKSISEPHFKIRSQPMVAGDFVAYCRYNGLLVKPRTETYKTLVKLVKFGSHQAVERISKLTQRVEMLTQSLLSILQSHWQSQGI